MLDLDYSLGFNAWLDDDTFFQKLIDWVAPRPKRHETFYTNFRLYVESVLDKVDTADIDEEFWHELLTKGASISREFNSKDDYYTFS